MSGRGWEVGLFIVIQERLTGKVPWVEVSDRILTKYHSFAISWGQIFGCMREYSCLKWQDIYCIWKTFLWPSLCLLSQSSWYTWNWSSLPLHSLLIAECPLLCTRLWSSFHLNFIPIFPSRISQLLRPDPNSPSERYNYRFSSASNLRYPLYFSSYGSALYALH